MYHQNWILLDYNFCRYTKIGFRGIFNKPLHLRHFTYTSGVRCICCIFILRLHMIHSLRLGTKKGQRKFWERHISMICLCSKYVKNCNIFGQILNIWVKLTLKKNSIFFLVFILPKYSESAQKYCNFWHIYYISKS